MDPLAKLNEQFLSCSICRETFQDPCTIGCYHTFCRRCLTKYTKTRRDAITAKSILCPNCLQMTKVPRPQEPLDQWCQQFKPSFLIQGLLDTFTSPGSSDTVDLCCFTCQQIGKTTQAKSFCEDCDIMFCEACAKMHIATPIAASHAISPMGAGSIPQFKKRTDLCIQHNCLVELCCKDCQKAICYKCSIIYHEKCKTVVTLNSMIPEMKQFLQNYRDINWHIQQIKNNLKSKRSEVEEVTQLKSSLQSEIKRVGQQAVDLMRRKEKKLLGELDMVIKKQNGKLKSQIKSGEIDLQTYQRYKEFIKHFLQSGTPLELYDMYTLCQSGEITADIQGGRKEKVEFENQLNVDQVDRTLQLGCLKFIERKSNLEEIKLLFTVSTKSKSDEEVPDLCDIEVLNIDGTETLVVSDYQNSSIKSCYTIDGIPSCTSVKLEEGPHALTKTSHDTVAVSHFSYNSIELIKLTPDPVLMSSIETYNKYRCLTILSDKTLAAGCYDPRIIDVLDLSGRVLRSVITPSTGQQLIQRPRYMCTTRQGHIVVADGGSESVYCLTQQGEVLYTFKLTGGGYWAGGVTTTDTGSVIMSDYYDNKIIQLTERGEYVRDLLTGQDGIVRPHGIRVQGNKLYVTEYNSEHIKIFQL